MCYSPSFCRIAHYPLCCATIFIKPATPVIPAHNNPSYFCTTKEIPLSLPLQLNEVCEPVLNILHIINNDTLQNKQVLIVGAGPVGLVMALQLARNGISPRIIEQLEQPLPYCRALGITARTLEIYEAMGIARQMIDAGIWLTGRHVIINGEALPDTVADLHGLPYGNLSVPQPVTEAILEAQLALYNIKIERGVQLTGLQQQEDNITVTLTRSGQADESTSFTYVIGCDGAHSAVRKLAGIGFEGERMPYDFMLGDVKINSGLPRGYSLQSLKPGASVPDFLVAIPLPEENRYRVSMPAPPEFTIEDGTDHGIQSERAVPGIEPLQNVFDRLYPGVALSDLRWSSIFRISMRLATNYRRGNIFIAGDAAHIHPPTGGQGMNTGIQDAYNLAWKLSAVINNGASQFLLDSYEAERQNEGMNVINETVQASINSGKQGFRLDPLKASQLLVNYRESPLTVATTSEVASQDALRAGDRVPNCEGLKRLGVAHPFRLSDLLSCTEHSLLIASNDAENILAPVNELISTLRAAYGERIQKIMRVMIIVSEPTAIQPPTGISIASDEAGNFVSTWPASANSAWLIRPDQYLAWAGNRDSIQDINQYFDKLFK